MVIIGLLCLHFGISANVNAQTSDEQAKLEIEQLTTMVNAREYSSAKPLLFEMRQKALSENSAELLFDTAYLLSEMYQQIGAPDSALYYLSEAINTHPGKEGLRRLYNSRAVAFSMMEQPASAMEDFRKALSLVPEEPTEENANQRARIIQNIANLQKDAGNYAESFSNYLLALEQSEASGDSLLQALVLNNIGDSYNSTGEYEKALFYLEKSLSISEMLGNKIYIRRAALNIANAKSNLMDYTEAESYYKRALALHRELNPNLPPIQIWYNMGSNYLKKGDMANAKFYLNESLSGSREMGIREGIYFNQMDFGIINKSEGNSANAIKAFAEAYEMATILKNPIYKQNASEQLYLAYKENGNNTQAIEFLEIFKSISDSLRTLERQKQLASIENRLEFNRQSQINELLTEKQAKQENTLKLFRITLAAIGLSVLLLILFLYWSIKTRKEIVSVNLNLEEKTNQLEELNQTKDKLLAIVSNDLRTPLASLHGILFLIKNNQLKSNEIRKFLNEMELSLQQNMQAIEDLLKWAQEQISGLKISSEEISLRSLLNEVIDAQQYSIDKKKINVEMLIEEQVSVLADREALRLICRNILGNAIKFTPQQGKIVISATASEHTVEICIGDSGIGIPGDLLQTLFGDELKSRKGTENEKGSGFGLKISKEFTERMNGNIRAESEVGKGSRFFVTLPKA